jgi:ectoine hydroxylase-related dioxygenase (phytanoyl-CoA dioxygenase family)
MGVTREEADASTILTCWVPLVDAPAAMGCLRVIPDQHDAAAGKGRGLLEHVKDADYGTTIRPDLLPPPLLETAVACEMRRGDILLMHHFTPHRSAPNLSADRVRWSIDLRFQIRGSPTGRPFWPELTVRSRADPAHEQRCYDQWCARWVHDLEASKGERWHRVTGDIGGSIAGRHMAVGAEVDHCRVKEKA